MSSQKPLPYKQARRVLPVTRPNRLTKPAVIKPRTGIIRGNSKRALLEPRAPCRQKRHRSTLTLLLSCLPVRSRIFWTCSSSILSFSTLCSLSWTPRRYALASTQKHVCILYMYTLPSPAKSVEIASLIIDQPSYRRTS